MTETPKLRLVLVSDDRVTEVANGEELAEIAQRGFATAVASDVLVRIVGFAQMTFRNQRVDAITASDAFFSDTPPRREVLADT